MPNNEHSQTVARTKTTFQMKAILSALLIVLSGATAVVAQQTALASLEDDSSNAAKNDRTLEEDRTLRHKDPPQMRNNNSVDTNLEHGPPVLNSAFVKIGDFKADSGRVTYTDSGRVPYFTDEYVKLGDVMLYVPDGRNDGKVTISCEIYGGITYLDGLQSRWAEFLFCVIAASDSPIEGVVISGTGTWFFKDVVGNGAQGGQEGEAVALKNVQITSFRADHLGNDSAQNPPVFYMPHYTDWSGRVVAVKPCDDGNLKDLVYKASQNNSNNAEAAIDPNETNDANENVDGYDGRTNSDGSTDSSKIGKIPTIPGAPWYVNLGIRILNWDHDNDGNTIGDELFGWIVDLFKEDEEGNEEGGEEEGGEEGDEEGGDEEGGDEEGDEDGGGEDGGDDDRDPTPYH